jgi:phosphoglycolate phosphatase
MPGVRDLLQSLIEIYPMVIVTAREPFAADHFLRQFDLHPYFRHVISGQTCVHTKPYPDPILHSAQLLGLQPGDLLMVGDTIVDILSARRAGAQSAGVLCGFGEETELRRAGADLILLTTSDLAKYLLPANQAQQE